MNIDVVKQLRNIVINRDENSCLARKNEPAAIACRLNIYQLG